MDGSSKKRAQRLGVLFALVIATGCAIATFHTLCFRTRYEERGAISSFKNELRVNIAAIKGDPYYELLATTEELLKTIKDLNEPNRRAVLARLSITNEAELTAPYLAAIQRGIHDRKTPKGSALDAAAAAALIDAELGVADAPARYEADGWVLACSGELWRIGWKSLGVWAGVFYLCCLCVEAVRFLWWWSLDRIREISRSVRNL